MTQMYYIFGPATTVLFIEVSLFQRVLIREVPLYSPDWVPKIQLNFGTQSGLYSGTL